MQISEQKEARVAQWRDFVTERLGREPRGFLRRIRLQCTGQTSRHKSEFGCRRETIPDPILAY
jgi:hypothetical protein